MNNKFKTKNKIDRYIRSRRRFPRRRREKDKQN